MWETFDWKRKERGERTRGKRQRRAVHPPWRESFRAVVARVQVLEPTLILGRDPRKGKYIPKLLVANQQKTDTVTCGRGSWEWQRSWGAAETKKPCLWWPALYPNLPLPSPSFLTRKHQVVDNGAFLPMSTVCYEWHIFFYWAFSIMDNTFIQTFSPSKNMMKYKTGILH